MLRSFPAFAFIFLMTVLGCSNSGDNSTQSAKNSGMIQNNSLTSCQGLDPTGCAPWNSYGGNYTLPTIFFPNQADPWYRPIENPNDTDRNSQAFLDSHMGVHDTAYRGPRDVLVECSLPYNVIDSKTDKISYIEVKGISDNKEADPNSDNDYDDPSGCKRIPCPDNMRFQNERWEKDPSPDAEKLDHHLLVYDKGVDTLYEVYQLRHQKVGRWSCGHKGFAVFARKAAQPRSIIFPTYHTSADAAGFAILPGLLRHEELEDEINHALRITFSHTFQGFVSPATHFTTTGPKNGFRLPMGARLRLRDTVDERRYPPKVQRILRCLKRYGAIVADNGTPFALSATDDCAFYNQTDLPGYRCSSDGNSFVLAADISITIRIRANDFLVMRLHNIQNWEGRTLTDSDQMKE